MEGGRSGLPDGLRKEWRLWRSSGSRDSDGGTSERWWGYLGGGADGEEVDVIRDEDNYSVRQETGLLVPYKEVVDGRAKVADE